MSNKNFDPSAIAEKNGNYFGLPYLVEESEVVILPCPWDVTTSYSDGTSRGPQAILEASYQLDFFSPFLEKAWDTKIGTLPFPQKILTLSRTLRKEAKSYIHFLEKGGAPEKNKAMKVRLEKINKKSETMHEQIEHSVKNLRKQGKKVILLGGDHSTSYGAIKAMADEFGALSILHIDAHADLRDSYEGFPHSHASIMFHALGFSGVKSITQVGIRDVSPDELAIIKSNPKLKTFFDWDIKTKTMEGISWAKQCEAIVESLGQTVYLSFDIDGLDPKLCPHTGTPVPGGLELEQILFLINLVIDSGRKLVGADLVEVAPGPKGDEWDANVGARALYQICQLLKKSSNPEYALTHPRQRRSMAL